MRYFRLIAAVLAAMALAACECTPERVPIPEPVEVEVVRYVPIPTAYLEECPAAPALRDGMTGGELLEAARAWRDRARCRDGQLEAIGRLK